MGRFNESLEQYKVSKPANGGARSKGRTFPVAPVIPYLVDNIAPSTPTTPQEAPVKVIIENPTRWRVVHDHNALVRGEVIWLKAGKVVDLQHYGAQGIQQMRDGGVELEPIG